VSIRERTILNTMTLSLIVQPQLVATKGRLHQQPLVNID